MLHVDKPRKKKKCTVPLAKSSDISKSFSFADMDRYKAVTDILLDCRTDFVSWDDMVFWRETGWKEEEEEVEPLEALDAGWSMVATDISGMSKPHKNRYVTSIRPQVLIVDRGRASANNYSV